MLRDTSLVTVECPSMAEEMLMFDSFTRGLSSRQLPLPRTTNLKTKATVTDIACLNLQGEVGRARLELATNALKGRCSTIELPTR